MEWVGLVLGGGGLAGLGLSWWTAYNSLHSRELIQWLVQVNGEDDTHVEFSIRPIGGDVRDVRLLVGVMPATFHPDKVGRAEWPATEALIWSIDAPRGERGRLFVFLRYRSSASPRWSHEAWIPVLEAGAAADLHLRQEARSSIAQWWRFVTFSYVLPVPKGVPYARSGPGRERRSLRRVTRQGGRFPVPRRYRSRA